MLVCLFATIFARMLGLELSQTARMSVFVVGLCTVPVEFLVVWFTLFRRDKPGGRSQIIGIGLLERRLEESEKYKDRKRKEATK